MHKRIRLVALDLDGTLLNSDKVLTAGNVAALQQAADAGIEIVPATGRFYDGMPEAVRALPFVRYVITVNGAEVLDLHRGESLCQAAIPWEQAVEIMRMLDTYPVIYDCYQDNAAWMSRELKERIDSTVKDPHFREMLHRLRQPVPELKAFLAQRQRGVHKIQLFTAQPELRLKLMREIPERFEALCVSSSMPENIEINQAKANKGQALLDLAAHLGIEREETLACGDDLNDLSLLSAAGVGVAMANASEAIRESADWVTRSCDEDGVAYAIKQFCFAEA